MSRLVFSCSLENARHCVVQEEDCAHLCVLLLSAAVCDWGSGREVALGNLRRPTVHGVGPAPRQIWLDLRRQRMRLVRPDDALSFLRELSRDWVWVWVDG
jgi:hypothetical protein